MGLTLRRLMRRAEKRMRRRWKEEHERRLAVPILLGWQHPVEAA